MEPTDDNTHSFDPEIPIDGIEDDDSSSFSQWCQDNTISRSEELENPGLR
jgi:hypothetical protein